MRALSSAAAILILAGTVFVGAASAGAVLPVYVGGSFPKINGIADPEEYSWRVELQPGQELKAVDDRHAEIYFEGGHRMGVIEATPARDVNGTAVPTTIGVSEGDVVTLVVHHRAGDPAADGIPFDYPITPGEPFEVGYSSVIVIPPKEETQPQEDGNCIVPKLKGYSLRADRRKLRAAGCRLGDVRGVRSRSAKVVRQYPKPGSVLGVDAEVGVKLG